MLYQADTMSALRSIPWFLELNPTEMENLANISFLRQAKTNEDLFVEGEKEDYLYVVLEGQLSLEIYIPTRGRMCITSAEPLDIIGWSSMTPVVRQKTASARATVPTRLIGFDAEALYRMCEEDHHLGYIIMRRLSNVVASRLLTTRIHLMDAFIYSGQKPGASQTFLE
jgi:CRP/FNR family transcriptional regulator, cyclic AMP receptor protein